MTIEQEIRVVDALAKARGFVEWDAMPCAAGTEEFRTFARDLLAEIDRALEGTIHERAIISHGIALSAAP